MVMSKIQNVFIKQHQRGRWRYHWGRIDEDQAVDYAKRKGWDEREMMKWLGVAMK